MTLSRWDEEEARFQSRVILHEEFALESTPGLVLAGEWTAPLVPDEAYQVTVCASDTSGPVVNLAVIVGSHDASAPCRVLAVLPVRPNRPMLNVPYHSLLRTSTELLCGREGIDWVDADRDGLPDTCPNGIVADRGGGGSGEAIAVTTFDNVPDGNGTHNVFLSNGVSFDDLFMQLFFSGPVFPLTPGDAYQITLGPLHTPTTLCPPLAR